MFNDPNARRCSFRPRGFGSKEGQQSMFTIVTMMGGDVTGQQERLSEKNYNQIVCALEDAKSYVEKFLIIKDIEQELMKSKCSYFLEQEGDNVIFQYHHPQSDSVDDIEIDSS